MSGTAHCLLVAESDASFESAVSQGYRTDDVSDEEQGFEMSMANLGWTKLGLLL